jgi:uncharacterized membrane protein
MYHMLGDYHSTMDPIFGLVVAAVLWVIVMIMIFINLRKLKVSKDRKRRQTHIALKRAEYKAYLDSQSAMQNTRNKRSNR